jgi:hypothetical protein
MANANKPMGLSPHSYLNGAKWNGQATVYSLLVGDTTNAYAIGDPVALGGSGDANGVPNIVLATAGAGNALLGAVVGLVPSGNVYGGAVGAGGPQFGAVVVPAGTRTATIYLLVADDPFIIYEVQEGGAGTALATTDLGTNINLLSGTNNGYASGWLLDNNSKATTSTYQMQLLRLSQKADNAFGTYAKWLARVNNHNFKAGTTGV